MTRELFEKDEFERGVFLLNVLAIVYNPETKLVLIGRRENDPHLPELSWTFPGGRPGYETDLEAYLKMEVKKKTNLEIEVGQIAHARTYPSDRRFLALYYLARPLNVNQENAGEKFVEIRWVKPSEVPEYFQQPPMDETVVEFLKQLEGQ